MNDTDPFAESLRGRLPLPPVSDDLLGRLERRAEWSQPRLQPLIVIGLTLAVLVCLVFYTLSYSSTAPSRPPSSGALPASLPNPLPANVPVAYATPPDDEVESVLSIVSKHRLEREPAFNFVFDTVAPRGADRQFLL